MLSFLKSQRCVCHWSENQIFVIVVVLHMSKRVTSGGVHRRDLDPVQHSSEKRRNNGAVGDTAFDLTVLGIEPQTSRTDSDSLNN